MDEETRKLVAEADRLDALPLADPTESLVVISISITPEVARVLYKDLGYTLSDIEQEKLGLTPATYSEEETDGLLDAYHQLRDGCINEGKLRDPQPQIDPQFQEPAEEVDPGERHPFGEQVK